MWIPIEKYQHSKIPWDDGENHRVLLGNDREIVIGYPYYCHDDDGINDFLYWTTGDGWDFKPTHYMPLPKLPEAGK